MQLNLNNLTMLAHHKEADLLPTVVTQQVVV